MTATGAVELIDVDDLEVGGSVTLPSMTATGAVELTDIDVLEVSGSVTLPSMTATGAVELIDAVIGDGRSLFSDDIFLFSTPGVIWLDDTDPPATSPSVQLVNATNSQIVANQQIDPDYIENMAEAT